MLAGHSLASCLQASGEGHLPGAGPCFNSNCLVHTACTTSCLSFCIAFLDLADTYCACWASASHGVSLVCVCSNGGRRFHKLSSFCSPNRGARSTEHGLLSPHAMGSFERHFTPQRGQQARIAVSARCVLAAGYLAAQYALKHPEHVEHLILVCPAGVVRRPPNFSALRGRGWSTRGCGIARKP